MYYSKRPTTVVVTVFVIAVVELWAENCTTPNNEIAECKSLYKCLPLLRGLITQNPKMIEFLNESHCGNSSSTDPMVCCGSTSTYIGIAEKIGRICGYQHSDDYYRSDTTSTAIDEFPWLAIVIYQQDDKSNFSCSGALIGYRYVLTAARCLNSPTSPAISVRLGEYDTQKEQDCVNSDLYEVCSDPIQDIAIQARIPHPNYNGNYGLNDIALLKLAKDVVFTDFIRPICLPTLDREQIKAGEILQFSGFGRLSSNGMFTSIKKKMLFALLSKELCSTHLVNVTENSFCVRELSENGVHFCEGDIGGPLLYSRNEKWHLEGIAVWNDQSCNGTLPVVFIEVYNYLGWIKEETNLF